MRFGTTQTGHSPDDADSGPANPDRYLLYGLCALAAAQVLCLALSIGVCVELRRLSEELRELRELSAILKCDGR